MADRKTTKTSSQTTEKQSTSSSVSRSESTRQSVLNAELRDELLAGLTGAMTEDELLAYARSLLAPQLNAGLEASQQLYETTRLAKEQEMENLAAQLTRAIAGQEAAYGRSIADVETAALARGMGRSSYTLQMLAQQGDALAQAVGELTRESEREREQLQQQISLAAQQNAKTQGRLNTDYADNLAAKLQELREEQRREQNQNYLTATSAALGERTQQTQTTEGQTSAQEQTQAESKTVSRAIGAAASAGSSSSSASSGSSKKKTEEKKTTAVASGGAYTKNRMMTY